MDSSMTNAYNTQDIGLACDRCGFYCGVYTSMMLSYRHGYRYKYDNRKYDSTLLKI